MDVRIDEAPGPPTLSRSVVETMAKQDTDAILIENGRPTMPP